MSDREFKVGDVIAWRVVGKRPPLAGEPFISICDSVLLASGIPFPPHSDRVILERIDPARITVADPPRWPEWAEGIVRLYVRIDGGVYGVRTGAGSRYHLQFLRAQDWPHGVGTFIRNPDGTMSREA